MLKYYFISVRDNLIKKKKSVMMMFGVAISNSIKTKTLFSLKLNECVHDPVTPLFDQQPKKNNKNKEVIINANKKEKLMRIIIDFIKSEVKKSF